MSPSPPAPAGRLPEWPALVAILIWSSLAAVSGGTLASVAAPALLAVALAAAAVALLAFELARGTPWRVLARPKARDVALGVYGLGGYHALLFASFERAPIVEANLLNELWPLLTVVLATPMAKEQLDRRRLAGAALGLAGAALVVGGASVAPSPAAMTGYALALGAAIVWATFTNLLKTHPLDPRTLLVACAIGAVLAAAWAASEGAAVPGGRPLAACLYLGALPLGLATLLWEAGVRRGRVAVVGALAYLTPLLSTLGVWLFLDQPLTAGAALGGALIVGGAALGTKS